MVLVSSNISILSVFKSARNFYPKTTLGLYKHNFGCQMKPSPQNTIWNSKTLEKLSKTCGPIPHRELGWPKALPTKAEVLGSSLPGGYWGIPQFTGEAYPAGSPGPQGDYGDA